MVELKELWGRLPMLLCILVIQSHMCMQQFFQRCFALASVSPSQRGVGAGLQ